MPHGASAASGLAGLSSQAWCTEYGVEYQVYEMLGHQIDALQLICPEVESISLNVNIYSESGRRSKRSRCLGI